MSVAEVFKRANEQLYINYSRIKFSNPTKCQYSRFSKGTPDIKYRALPGVLINHDWKHYRIYGFEFDLTRSPDWFFSDRGANKQWPLRHFAGINYRPGNLHGDVRFNWELNRLQFLPAMALFDASLTQRLILDWSEKNPFLHGPGYLAAMEVALRWISIYWAACLLGKSLKPAVQKNLTGLAITSGNYIKNRLSTHSSAGNHLIVEAVGLFWLGKALEHWKNGRRWIKEARAILGQQVMRQINSDGSNQEQSFWYLGFVVDALLHYLLLEDHNRIAGDVWLRIQKALEFIHDMTLPEGSFPDYGDRDDGVVFRCGNAYEEAPFAGLLNIGSYFFNRPEWTRDNAMAKERLRFWQNISSGDSVDSWNIFSQKGSNSPQLKFYPDGGMTLMQWGRGRLLFRHASLGIEDTCGHGHADALSVLFYWDSIPVLIDLGSGQYNGNQNIRNYFRSTIAHNTVEIGGKNQARILGPFMWDKSYRARLENYSVSPTFSVTASHDGYLKSFGRLHTRQVRWIKADLLNICDSFLGESEVPIRGAFHLGSCKTARLQNNLIEADFNHFKFCIEFSREFSVDIYYGSKDPFLGWRSTVYGKWEPTHSIIFSTKLFKAHQYKVSLKISDK
jgi:hypothetical protein